jgi:hypothetical protein
MKFTRLSIFFLLVIVIFACKKPSNVGTGILPDDDDLNLTFNDTTSLVSQNLYNDTLRSDKLGAPFMGNLNDLIFGFSKALVYAEVGVISGIKDTLPNYYLDSVVLLVKYDFTIGDTNTSINLKVHKVDLALNRDTGHSSIENFDYSTEIGAAQNIYFKPSIKRKMNFADTVGLSNIMRVKLNSFFGYSLLSQFGTSTMLNSTNFRNYLPAIAIIPDGTSGNVMAQMNLTNTNSNILLYYHTDKTDSLVRTFPLNLTTFNFSKFQHNYVGTQVAASINTNLPKGDEVAYLQGQAGIKTLVTFPTISNYGKIAINKAELVITQLYDDQTKVITPPSIIYALKKTETGSMLNFSGIQATNAGGVADTTQRDEFGRKIYVYKINLTTYLQDVVLGKEPNNGIFLSVNPFVSNASSVNLFTLGANRLMFGGSNHPNPKYKMKLNLKYTTLN